jgi:hypothetical protein
LRKGKIKNSHTNQIGCNFYTHYNEDIEILKKLGLIYGINPIDFLKYDKTWHGDIVTNPPYKFAKEFIEKSMEVISEGNKVAMFLKIQFLEGKARKLLFAKYPPRTIYVSSSRLLCAKNAIL